MLLPAQPFRAALALRRALLAGLILIFGAGLARAATPMTGRVLPVSTLVQGLPQARLGGTAYAEVNSAWLREFYSQYRSKLAKLGVVNWDQRYDCRRFAGMFTELAQTEFFTKSFHDSIAANTLALGQVWYFRQGRGGHAIVVAFTERGRIFLDPQDGKEVQLTAAEQKSIYLAVL